MEPNGPLKTSIIRKIRTQMGDDPPRWRREMEAEWAEDEDVWLTQSLIASCIGTSKTCGEDLQEYNSETQHRGEFFAGLDLAQTRDYSVLSVVERRNDKLFLRHVKIFQQPTVYATVLGYMKALQDRWGRFERIRVDFTRARKFGSTCFTFKEKHWHFGSLMFHSDLVLLNTSLCTSEAFLGFKCPIIPEKVILAVLYVNWSWHVHKSVIDEHAI